jgi:polysaccharide export outer membrane protein
MLKSAFYLVVGLLVCGCASYKQNIMFRTDEDFKSEPIQKELLNVESNYTIQKNDILLLSLYSNNGEKLIDPNPELSEQQTQNSSNASAKQLEYLVDESGKAKFPMMDEFKIEGLTIRQAEMVLQKEYEKFFKSPFVKLTFNNKRVFLLGAPGGQVLPLQNENTTLIEVLAMGKGFDNTGKASNIRVLRGEQVFQVDLSTIDGYRQGNIKIQPNDIVYVEPVRKPFSEGLRDYSPLVTILAAIATLIAVLTR